MNAGKAYWTGGRTFVPVVVGRKHVTGLAVEPEGLGIHSELATERLSPVEYRGEAYPTRKLLAFLRARRGTTEGAEKLRKRIIKEMTS